MRVGEIQVIGFEAGDTLLRWQGLCDAIRKGHRFPKAKIADSFLYREPDTLLSRAAVIDGMGMLVKTATVFPDNPKAGLPMVNGAVSLFSNQTGALEAMIDFHLVTKWKTAGDSVLAASMLARPDSRIILIVGAGTVGRNLRAAYGAMFPDAEFRVWNRTYETAQKFAQDFPDTMAVQNLEEAVRSADIVTSATMSTDALIKGDWLQAGQHIDLIGAYRPDMREVDDAAILRARVFVDSMETTLDHIGELKIPLESGVIGRDDIVADYYDMNAFKRRDDTEVTLFKNGGGAHMDLMTGRYILQAWREA